MEIIYPRCAGIDVGKRKIAVAVRTPGDTPGERCQQIRMYKTFYQVLLEMVAWLVEEGVTYVAMESTGVYWKPVFHALCETEQIEVLLVNARHVTNVPGRKTDVKPVGPRHDRGAHRRRARSESPGRPGPRGDAEQDPGSDHGLCGAFR